MRKILLSIMVVAFGAALALPSIVSAHSSPPTPSPYPFTLIPNEFVGAAGDCGTGSPAGDPDKVTSEWVKTTGNPSPSIKLQKLGLTSSCIAAQVDVVTPLEGQPVSNLTELNFDVKDGWHCGNGAPRFNLQSGAKNAFLGCNFGGTQTSLGNGWTHIEFNQAQITAALATAAIAPTDTLDDLYMIFDEGSDTGPDFTGTAFVDNFSVNNQVVGSPSVPRSKNDCKNDGWKNLTDRKGTPFESESDCRDFLNNHKDRKHHHNNRHGHHYNSYKRHN